LTFLHTGRFSSGNCNLSRIFDCSSTILQLFMNIHISNRT
jgi:hypothetical protein